jgi:Cu(I)-responsive transcriptional regulator
MNIGSVADRSGVPAKTIRYYENVGLIPPARRSGNGYRNYTEVDVQTLRFVQRARSLGFSVEDVSNLLDLWRDKKRASAEVKSVAKRHLAKTEEKIRQLESICRVLEDLIGHCHGDNRPDCPILDEFSKDTKSS